MHLQYPCLCILKTKTNPGRFLQSSLESLDFFYVNSIINIIILFILEHLHLIKQVIVFKSRTTTKTIMLLPYVSLQTFVKKLLQNIIYTFISHVYIFERKSVIEINVDGWVYKTVNFPRYYNSLKDEW